MLSFRVRSCSLLEPEHSRLTPYIPFALLDIIKHMVQPFQVRHEQPAEGARVSCNELPGFRCPLQPVRLPASEHTIQRRCCVTTYQVRCLAFCFTHEGAFHTPFPVFLVQYILRFLATSASTLENGCSLVFTGTPFSSYFATSISVTQLMSV